MKFIDEVDIEIISGDGGKVLASASTAEAEVRKSLGAAGKGGNVVAAFSGCRPRAWPADEKKPAGGRPAGLRISTTADFIV